MFPDNRDFCSAIRCAVSYGSLNRAYSVVVTSDELWCRLVNRMGAQAFYLDSLPGLKGGEWRDFCKRRFCEITQWMRDQPGISQNEYPVFAWFTLPVACKWKADIELFTFDQDHYGVFSMVDDECFSRVALPAGERWSPPYQTSKGYVARSEDFVARSWEGDSKIFIFSGDNTYKTKLELDGKILQISVKENYLYVRWADTCTQKLTIWNLTALEEKPVAVNIPAKFDHVKIDCKMLFCVGKTDLLFCRKENENYELFFANVSELKNCNSERSVAFHAIDRQFSAIPEIFEQGNHFVATCLDGETHRFSAVEIHLSGCLCYTKVLADNISIFDDDTILRVFYSVFYSNERVFLYFNETGVNKFISYDIEKRRSKILFEEKGRRLSDVGVPVPFKILSMTTQKICLLYCRMISVSGPAHAPVQQARLVTHAVSVDYEPEQENDSSDELSIFDKFSKECQIQ